MSVGRRRRQWSVTFDDPHVEETPLLAASARNARLLEVLARTGRQAALLVCGKRVDSAGGRALLCEWDAASHALGNHSYSHINLNHAGIDVAHYEDDIERMEPLLVGLRCQRRWFRYPFLREGDTEAKRDHVRRFLAERRYRWLPVTVDNSDWYIDRCLCQRLRIDPAAPIDGFRDYYVAHIWERAQFYDQLLGAVIGREAPHVLLLHHNLASALFLADLLAMFAARGWSLLDADETLADALYQRAPNTLPAGESLAWALAHESGRFEGRLRYPAEDLVYERGTMARLGLCAEPR